MTWTIYRLSDGEMLFDGWPGEDHPSETGFAFDADTMGAVAGASTQLALQVWSPTALEWTYSPQIARDGRWEAAKTHWDVIGAAGFVIPGIGTIQTDAASREAIGLLVDEARDRIAAGETAWTTAFINEENEPVPVTAMQILAIYAAVRAFLGGCYAARQSVRGVLDAALAAGATAEQINAIDITVDYSTSGS